MFYLINVKDYDDEAFDLAEAKERACDENTSADDFIRYLRGKDAYKKHNLSWR